MTTRCRASFIGSGCLHSVWVVTWRIHGATQLDIELLHLAVEEFLADESEEARGFGLQLKLVHQLVELSIVELLAQVADIIVSRRNPKHRVLLRQFQLELVFAHSVHDEAPEASVELMSRQLGRHGRCLRHKWLLGSYRDVLFVILISVRYATSSRRYAHRTIFAICDKIIINNKSITAENVNH